MAENIYLALNNVLYNVLHSISIFTGRLHPLLVHLPIGFLLMALLLWYMSGRARYLALAPAVPVVLLAGVLCALLSCITGLFLAGSGEYDGTTVNLHMWMGITTTLVSAWLYSQVKSGQPRRQAGYTGAGLLVLISVTGHLGGSLTHGGNYLMGAFSEDAGKGGGKEQEKRVPIADVQQADVYAAIIQPVLAAKCYSCHGPNKQKGRLRMDQFDQLMKGGKDGVVIVPGKPLESELMKRLALPPEDEHHMAPKEKPQLSSSEIGLLSWWIGAGAPQTKKVHELAQSPEERKLLTALQGNTSGQEEPEDQLALMTNDEIPAEAVATADEKDIDALRAKGAMVIPVAANSHYIAVNCLHATGLQDRDLALLKPLRRQLISLKLSHTPISDEGMSSVASCDRLIRLHLDYTKITDRGLGQVALLPRLRYLNLVGTGITASGLESLKGMKDLKQIYLYQTNVDKTQWPGLQAVLKGVALDSGGYTVPTLATDTTLVKPTVRTGGGK